MTDLDRIIHNHPSINIKVDYGDDGDNIDTITISEYSAPNGQFFTFEDMLSVVLNHERQHRHKRLWFDNMDRSHIYFEGLNPVGYNDDTYFICWGS